MRSMLSLVEEHVDVSNCCDVSLKVPSHSCTAPQLGAHSSPPLPLHAVVLSSAPPLSTFSTASLHSRRPHSPPLAPPITTFQLSTFPRAPPPPHQIRHFPPPDKVTRPLSEIVICNSRMPIPMGPQEQIEARLRLPCLRLPSSPRAPATIPPCIQLNYTQL